MYIYIYIYTFISRLRTIEIPQRAISSLERCRKPVISVVDGACIGGGVDLICAGDIRYCTAAAYFCIKEVAVGLVRSERAVIIYYIIY